jgi:hypothetical protein
MQSLSSRVESRNARKAVVRILDNGGGVRWVLKMGFERNNQKRWHAHHHHHHARHHHVRVECVCLSACDSLLSLSSSSFFRVSRFSMISANLVVFFTNMTVEAVFESLLPPIKHPSPGTEIAAPTHFLEKSLLGSSLLAAFVRCSLLLLCTLNWVCRSGFCCCITLLIQVAFRICVL